MKNKLKFIIISAVLAALLSLAGCAELNINASIDQRNVVDLSYEIIIPEIDQEDINYTETKSFLGKIMKYWTQEEGFDTHLDSSGNTLHLSAHLTKECASRQEAFQELYNYMTNSVSPFVNVTYDYNQNFYYEDYSLNAAINLSGIIDDDIYTVYPSIVGDDADEFLNNLKCTVTVSLPQNESDVSDAVTLNVVTVDVPVDSETEIAISGIINNNVNVRYENNLLATKAYQKKMIIILSAAAAALVGVLVLIIVLRKKQKKKERGQSVAETEVNVKEDADFGNSGGNIDEE